MEGGGGVSLIGNTGQNLERYICTFRKSQEKDIYTNEQTRIKLFPPAPLADICNVFNSTLSPDWNASLMKYWEKVQKVYCVSLLG